MGVAPVSGLDQFGGAAEERPRACLLSRIAQTPPADQGIRVDQSRRPSC
jgi:hypothetical protein